MTAEASDDAHGVFEFSAESLSVNGTEPEDGDSDIVLQVTNLCVSHCGAVLSCLCFHWAFCNIFVISL